MTHTPAIPPGLNRLAAPLVEHLVSQADALRLTVSRQDNGTRIVDAGIAVPGGIEAGLRIAEICLGGLGRVALQPASGVWSLAVSTAQPVLACLGSQYAGWSLSHGEGKGSFFALGSGPGRALAAKEELFKELGYRDTADSACLVLETGKVPPLPLLDKIAGDCGVAADRLTLILTPTSSLAGATQVVARVLEVALHKAHFLGFPLEHIVDGMGTAPLCPPSPDFLTAMGRTNDAILFGGDVQLYVTGDDAAAEDLARKLPSEASSDYGRPFAEVFKAAGHDFYKIDPLLFAPARVAVTCLASGRTFRAGRLNPELLERSFA
ncbi:methenyltetrahydromethanopterin cyclohydrolase [Betaproteobacteria bacterium SCN1]|jgi:methenyltetrahydromethanopterin cyclohydrolase|nr:methenyltetrahydromethanopterin cyclohydrolase [Betaproteobacteria bacterium SCN1]MBN8761080.1 methenyltetrahydromethanopterin cyclohydrolase [Thiobacillus sp.]ODU87552.1 MAG: methenyltetrahydromethanopterin cyclohydrolase [Thiobacillus sp. SCN 65-179]OJW38699.1 MAG: methenyltetrahydromethanopterin cyclohydrolase [Thiobacillus sp. 65-69]